MFEVTQKDLIGELEGFPIEVVRRMLINQVSQGYAQDVNVFQRLRSAGVGGFLWYYTPEGPDFWSDVIDLRRWDIFFQRYPSEDFHGLNLTKTKPLNTKHKIHFTKAQRWCLSRIVFNNNATRLPLIEKLKIVFTSNVARCPHFDYPILAADVAEAKDIFFAKGEDYDTPEFAEEVLRNRIYTALKSILWSLKAFSEKICCGIELWRPTWDRRDIINWLRKNIHITENCERIYFRSFARDYKLEYRASIDYIGPSYRFDKSIGAYTDDSGNIILGNKLFSLY